MFSKICNENIVILNINTNKISLTSIEMINLRKEQTQLSHLVAEKMLSFNLLDKKVISEVLHGKSLLACKIKQKSCVNLKNLIIFNLNL